MKTRVRVKPGDVLEVSVGQAVSYAYIGRHPRYGDAILVEPSIRSTSAPVTPELFTVEAYVAFYPAKVAANQGPVKPVGNLPCRDMPRVLRRAGHHRVGNRVLTWVIEVDVVEQAVKATLAEAELAFPIVALLTHQTLLNRLESRWNPRVDGTASQ